jgi:hypothetical protein
MSWDSAHARRDELLLSRFGVPATFLLNGVTIREGVNVSFDQSVETWSPGQADLTEFRPAITVASADVADVPRTATVVIGTTEYRFYHEPEPDGHGLTQILLVKK